MSTPIALRASAKQPCEVCGHGTKGCSVTADGMHICRGEPRDGWKCLTRSPDNAGFHHFRRLDDNSYERNGNTHAPPPAKPATDWAAKFEEHRAACTEEHRTALARVLGLPLAALDAVPIGWRKDQNGECWVFPEQDAYGNIIGLSRRYTKPVATDGGTVGKMSLGHRGLTVPTNWRDRDGPLFIVEGQSDVLALTVCGLSAIGRPSNSGGGLLLADVLRPHPNREIYITAENDPKPDGSWPGRDGAEAIAKKLSEALGRPVWVTYPPNGIKDCREWTKEIASGFGESDDWEGAGREIAAHLVSQAKAFLPSKALTSASTEPPKPRFEFIDSTTFAAGDYRPQWLVPRILVKNQPGVIAGPSKSLKTGTSIDLAVSIAAGLPFLDKFDIPKKTRVAVVSGESGEHTLQETAARICKAKGIALADVGKNLAWCFSLPTFSDHQTMREFADTLKGLNAEVVIVDPVYLAMGNVDMKSMFEAGAAFRVVAEVLLKAGCTPLLIHHANRQLVVGDPMELTHLAYSGLDQFARQFILLNRREKYKGDGVHDLWATVGGSAGHGGLWNLHIEEGVVDENFAGREWNVTVQTPSEAQGEHVEQREAAKREAARKKIQAEETAVLRAIDAEIHKGQPGATKTQIKEQSGLGTSNVKEVIAALLESGTIEEVEFKKSIGSGATRDVCGYRRVNI